jgi:hypothetical protein
MRSWISRAATLVAFALLATSAWAQAYEAEIELRGVPSSMSPGATASIDANIRNTGDEDWPNRTFIYVDAYEDPKGNAVSETAFLARKQIGSLPAGQANSVFGSASIKVEAPEARGTWKLRAWIEAGGRECDGAAEFEIEVQDGYYGKFTRFDAPKEMIPGLEYTFNVTVENSGDVQWDSGEVVLESKIKRTVDGSANEGKAAFEKRHKIENEDIVYPGDDYTFRLKMEAPPNNGEWQLEWQLYDLEEGRSFGQSGTSTHKVATNEGGYAARLSIDRAPSSLEVNELASIEVTVENAGRDFSDDAYVIVAARRDPHGNRGGTTTFDTQAEIGALPAGQEAEVELDILGSAVRGEWEIIVWVEVDGRKVSGEEDVDIEIEGYYEGKISDIDYEDEYEAGDDCTVELRVENTGDLFWSEDGVGVDVSVKRTEDGSSSAGKRAFEQKHEVTNDDVVEPGDRYDFEIDFDLPDEPGEWQIEFELYDIETRRSFGSPETITIKVLPEG